MSVLLVGTIGGAAAAGEELRMEGTGGLLNAGRVSMGASVGSGVAAGASSALGHSNINEQIPLSQGTANRLGGREGESRLIAKIQETVNNQHSITPPPATLSRNPYTI
jgi:hypothetical protein